MKLMTSILAVAMMAGGAAAQNPNVINNVQNKVDAAQPKSANSAPVRAAKPGAGAPAPAVKPAQIPGAKPVAATKPAAAASSTNKLERVNVISHPDEIQIELSSQQAVTPKVTKLSSPERLLIELPATADVTAKNKIAVGSAGVKGVRIGMDGKTPPTTSVVIDLEKAHEYEMTPGPATKLVLTLHGQEVAKNVAAPAPAAKSAPVVAKNSPIAAKSAPTVAKSSPAPVSANRSASAAKPQMAVTKPLAAPAVVAPKVAAAQASAPVAPKATAKAAAPAPAAPKQVIAAAPAAKTVVAAKNDVKPATPAAPITAPEKPAEKIAELPKPPKPEEKKWAMTGKRDPFFSPVVQDNSGSGCSTGKKCLEIGQINVRGVVKSDTGYIAVVTNSQDKAYFLHENDPVFNGYVLKITGDSVVFQETVQDKLGKPFLREVTKKITTPAV